MAKELASEGILVNGVAPEIITTPFYDRYTPPEMREQMVKVISTGREGMPEETIGAMLFLASSAADYLVDEVVEIHGGQLMS